MAAACSEPGCPAPGTHAVWDAPERIRPYCRQHLRTPAEGTVYVLELEVAGNGEFWVNGAPSRARHHFNCVRCGRALGTSVEPPAHRTVCYPSCEQPNPGALALLVPEPRESDSRAGMVS